MKRIVLTIILLFPLLAMAQEDFYERVNKIRARRLLPKLEVDQRLVLECKKWTIKLDGKVYHDPMTFRGEVITNCLDPLECWMESKVHRKLLLKRKYRYIGYYKFNGVACARLK